MISLTPTKRVLFMRRVAPVLFVLFGVFSLVTLNLRSGEHALAATQNTVNFQARLQTAAGSIVPDGLYNLEFKLYSASSGGTALWTEDYYDSNGVTAGNDNRVTVKNGYLSLNLGSQTAFPSTVNWDQQLWVTMNVGGTTQTATPTYDGEMNPRLQLTAVPYAFKAGQLAQANSGGTLFSNLSIQAPTVGNQSFVVQDQGAAGTYNILTAPSGSDGYIKLQSGTPGTAQTGSFNISGTGMAGTFLTGSLDSAAGGNLYIGTTNATSMHIAQTGVTSYFGGNINTNAVETTSVDLTVAGTLALGNTNATTIEIAANNTVAHTIDIGTGNSSAQGVTVGSTYGSSGTTIQGGSTGIGLKVSGSGTIGAYVGGTKVMGISTNGYATFNPVSDSANAFVVQNAAGNATSLSIDTSTGITTVQALHAVGTGVSVDGYLTFTGSNGTGTYTTPLGSSVSSRIVVTNANLPSYSQILALGVTNGSSSSARAILLADARTGTHQETITVLSPDENQTLGLSWQGATNTTGNNGTPMLSTSAATIGLGNSGGTGALTVTASGSTQTAQIGGNGVKDGILQFSNSSSAANTAIQATSVSASYVTNLPTAIGTAGQCLSVASIASTTQTLGYSNCLTSASGVQNQNSGQQASTNFWISGTGRADTSVLTPVVDTASAAALTIGTTNASSITIGKTGSTTTIAGTTQLGASAGTGALVNNGSTVNTTLALGDFAAGGSIGSAATTVDVYTSMSVAQTTAGQTLTIATPTASTTYGRVISLSNIGSTSFTLLGVVVNSGATVQLTWSNTSGGASWQFVGGAGVQLQSSSPGTAQTGNFNISGTGTAGALQAATFDTASAGSLDIGNTNATTINIATNATPHTISIGTGAAVEAIVIGSTTSTSNLTFQAGTGGLTFNAGTFLVNVGGSTVMNIDSGGKTTFKPNADATDAFKIQNAAGTTTLFNVNTTASTITLGSGSNTFTVGATGEPTLAGTARHSKSIVLTPEFAGAVIDATNDVACSSANNGAMTSGYQAGISGFGNGNQNYYKWTSSQGTSQCYDVVAQVAVPSDWSAWTSTPMTINGYTTNTTNGTLKATVYDSGGYLDTNWNVLSVTPGSTSTWTTSSSSAFTGTHYTAGSYMTVIIRMNSLSGADVRLGNITLNYLSSY